MSVVQFDRRQGPESVKEGLSRSLDLMDLAERVDRASVALYAATGGLRAAHILSEPPAAQAFDVIRRAAGDVFAALAEFEGNARLAAARADDQPQKSEEA